MGAGKDNNFGGIVHTAGAVRPLSKPQQAFHALLEEVESLRASIDIEEAELDAAVAFYSTEIVPRLASQTAVKKDLVRSLAPFVNKSFFPNREERLRFKDFTKDLLDAIAKDERGLTDGDLRDIYNVVHGVGYAQDEQKTLAAVKAALAKMFAEEGLEPDLSELESTASEADFMTKAEALMARLRKMKQAEAEAERCAEHGRHGTDDEELRAAEEARKRNIASIYKQLARVLHPDFECDGERQKQKVQLMQELTEAYRQKDLHTLLRLEMQWIENEGDNLDRLTGEKLGVYIEVLEGQVQGLQARLRDLLFHPRYRPIVAFNNGLARPIDGPNRARELDETIAAMKHSIALLENAGTADDVRVAIAAAGPERS